MRILFVLLVLVGCARPYGGSCDDVDGLKVNDFDLIPDNYTGVAIRCKDARLQALATYKNGNLDGVLRRWHENGQLWWEENYKDGKLDGVEKMRYENGQLEYEANYKDGKLDGVEKMRYENGQLEYEANYKDGKKDSVERRWHENGQLWFEMNHKDGKIIDDKVVYYNEDGAIYKTKYYEDGEMTSCEGDCD